MCDEWQPITVSMSSEEVSRVLALYVAQRVGAPNCMLETNVELRIEDEKLAELKVTIIGPVK